jgi:superfamily II DNA or RNA helicase
LGQVRQGPHLLIVADEVHRAGSREYRKVLGLHSGPRLGLSATPHRAGDPVGTNALLTYFGDILQPPFTIADAIGAGVLTRYMYHPHMVLLTGAEQAAWSALSDRANQIYARMQRARGDLTRLEARLRQLLFERARILKRASGKVRLAVETVQSTYQLGDRWIVYCEAIDQLNDVLNGLRAANLPALEYHSSMAGDRTQTLRHFETNGGVVVSIRCLDEGVDIPNVTHALILASSKNPREFVQRRGRVLRRAPEKSMAVVHDAVVVPVKERQDAPPLQILEGELARAIEFGTWADNPSAITDLKLMALDAGIEYERLRDVGFEDDEAGSAD